MSERDFNRVKEYLISSQIEGWWNYVTTEEYRKIKGEYHFGGKYLRYQKEIQQIADKLGIPIQKGEVPFVTSEEDFNAIVQKLDITKD